MKDNEIIKALECCKKDDCDNCPNDFGNCYANLAGYALDLINRQKAEIEKYDQIKTLIERLWVVLSMLGKTKGKEKPTLEEFAEAIQEIEAEAKTEAYKEVFEKLNNKALVRKIKLFGNWFIVRGVTLHDINTLKKELVGDNND